MAMEIVNLRLSKRIIDLIEKLVDEGLFINRSHFIRTAILNYILEMSKSNPIFKEMVERYGLLLRYQADIWVY